MRVLDALLGAENICNPTIRELSGSFGMENAIGKTLMKITEMNADDPKQLSQACSIINAISGEDPVDINRKNMKIITVQLATRILMAGNQFPNFRDHATALAARLLVIPFNVSFVGREDYDLTERLRAELAGILNWAIDGLADLRREGRFSEPEGSRLAKEEIIISGNPLRQFLNEECELGPSLSIEKDELFAAYSTYCRRNGAHPLDKARFGSALITASSETVVSARPREGGNRFYAYKGIRLRDDVGDTVPTITFRLDPGLLALGFDPNDMEAILRDPSGNPVLYHDGAEDFD